MVRSTPRATSLSFADGILPQRYSSNQLETQIGLETVFVGPPYLGPAKNSEAGWTSRPAGKEFMSIADEIEKLAQLRKTDVLSEEEFQQAKAILLEDKTPTSPAPQNPDNASLGQAANRYVSFQIVSGVIAMVVVLSVFLGLCTMNENQKNPPWMRDLKHTGQPIQFPK